MASTASRIRQPAGSVRGRRSRPASPQDVTAIVEDPNGLLWLISGTLQRFDPVGGRFTARRLTRRKAAKRTGKFSLWFERQKRISPAGSFLAIDQTGVLWVATAHGLVRFDRERERVHDL